MSKRNHLRHQQGRIAAVVLRRADDSLLNRTGNVGEYIISVGADEPNRAHDDYQNHGQHHGVLRDILTFFVAPQSPNVIHNLPPSSGKQPF
jgi:hypothetical protein